MVSVIARIPSLCVDIRYGHGDTVGTQRVFSVQVRIFTLFDSIIGGVFNVHFVYVHLGAMQP